MLIVIIALGSTDLLFALDSIPAIYGLTQEPYLVFTANVFALMGLRQLYFLIGGLLKRLVYLSIGLSVILAFIGVKLILEALHAYHLADWAPFDGEIPIWLSLLGHHRHPAHHHRGQPDQEPVRRGPAHHRRGTRRRAGQRQLTSVRVRLAGLPSPECRRRECNSTRGVGVLRSIGTVRRLGCRDSGTAGSMASRTSSATSVSG